MKLESLKGVDLPDNISGKIQFGNQFRPTTFPFRNKKELVDQMNKLMPDGWNVDKVSGSHSKYVQYAFIKDAEGYTVGQLLIDNFDDLSEEELIRSILTDYKEGNSWELQDVRSGLRRAGRMTPKLKQAFAAMDKSKRSVTMDNKRKLLAKKKVELKKLQAQIAKMEEQIAKYEGR